ncbi:CGG triplet repeat-binding protein 1 [Aphis craccivora]|uniref:CGG triplet repeat-binding protein 1 n=1 Tax=Aphis craccivora TaxID=307492 RepID=A0A6G0Y3Q4_APHCR|nr:CGG triplet repeat-binding protein 1 [Aphis craccivora]
MPKIINSSARLRNFYVVLKFLPKKYNIQQHIARGKHIQQLNIRNQQEKPKSQVLLTANIPLTKLNIPIVRNFLHKHTKQIIPDESTLRKNYIDQCYTNTIIKIRDYVRNKNIWVSIDETTDVEGRYVANVIIGTLEVNNPGKIFLLNSEVLEKANHSTISKLFDRSLFILWPEGVLYDNVLLFVSEAAP